MMMQASTVDIAELDGDYMLVEIMPRMVHPDDDVKRSHLTAVMKVKRDLAVSPNEAISDLLGAAEISVFKDMDKAVAGACMAGDVLLALLSMSNGKVADAGFDKACHAVSAMYDAPKKGADGGLRDRRGQTFKAGRDTVMNHWAKYRSVAHLWAAFLILKRIAEARSPALLTADWLEGRDLTNTAQSLLISASQFCASHQWALIFCEAALKMRGPDPGPILIPPMTERLKEALSTFTPRIRD